MQKRILAAILDWGLGHASRMVPVIECLAANNAEVLLASSGAAASYLRQRFPQMTLLELPAPSIRYDSLGASTALIRQALSQKSWNAKQHAWTQLQAQDHRIDAIISDNVYGAWSPEIPSVLISHQLQLPAPLFGKMINRELGRWLTNFDQIWVPDTPDGIAGKLTQSPFCEKPIHYLGTLSRLKPVENVEKQYTCVALISGPEPQRSIFEKHCLAYLQRLPGRKAVIRGKATSATSLSNIPADTDTFDFLDGQELATLLQSANYVLCRSGYSTLCDLSALGCSAIVVPTPGQYEQLYLAKRAADKGWALTTGQDAIANFTAHTTLDVRFAQTTSTALNRLILELCT